LNKRIGALRRKSLQIKPYISLERGKLLTEFYKADKGNYSVPMTRARAFKYILGNMSILIDSNELIVGERGPGPKATPTYPEICTHTRSDLEILHNRSKVPYHVSESVKNDQVKEVTPFWQGRSLRQRIFKKVNKAWKAAYSAGVFTEFMEQRAPGHTVLDDKIYHKGLNDFKREIESSINHLSHLNDDAGAEKIDQLQAMSLTADAVITFAMRHSHEAKRLADLENEPGRKKELLKISHICSIVPGEKPDSFQAALQYYWFVHLGVIIELNTWDSFNPGRLDQHLWPFYKKDLEKGIINKEQARELLQAFWIKFNNQPAPPKVGVTAQESNTYTDFCLINLAGLNADGQDASNELTYLILDVIEEMRLLQPSSMVQISHKTPDQVLTRALNIIKTGYGQPSLFNTDAIIKELMRQGKTIEDARSGGASGCVESGAFGKESYILTGYFNLPKILEITLNNGTDPRTGKLIGLATGAAHTFKSYEQFYAAYEKQINHFVDIKINGNLIIEQLWADFLPAPFLSLLIDDCISTGLDYNRGGARYNTAYIQGVGLGTATDSLTAIKYHVYDLQKIQMAELIEILNKNYRGENKLRQSLLDLGPRYGNDNDYADDNACRIFETFFKAVDGRPNTKGGHFRINLLPTTSHIYFGSVMGATADGRLAWEPVSEGISPVQGADRKGPTAVLKSAGKIDHIRTGGTLLNQKFTPQLMAHEASRMKVASLIRAYFKLNGHHIQFNVVTAHTLRQAQLKPEQYKDLIVRVAGYSDYFVDLTEELQNEIITRNEYGAQENSF